MLNLPHLPTIRHGTGSQRVIPKVLPKTFRGAHISLRWLIHLRAYYEPPTQFLVDCGQGGPGPIIFPTKSRGAGPQFFPTFSGGTQQMAFILKGGWGGGGKLAFFLLISLQTPKGGSPFGQALEAEVEAEVQIQEAWMEHIQLTLKAHLRCVEPRPTPSKAKSGSLSNGFGWPVWHSFKSWSPNSGNCFLLVLSPNWAVQLHNCVRLRRDVAAFAGLALKG